MGLKASAVMEHNFLTATPLWRSLSSQMLPQTTSCKHPAESVPMPMTRPPHDNCEVAAVRQAHPQHNITLPAVLPHPADFILCCAIAFQPLSRNGHSAKEDAQTVKETTGHLVSSSYGRESPDGVVMDSKEKELCNPSSAPACFTTFSHMQA